MRSILLAVVASFGAAHAAAADTVHLLKAPRGVLRVVPPAHAFAVEPVGVRLAAVQALAPDDEFVLDTQRGPIVARVVRRRPTVDGFALSGMLPDHAYGCFALVVVDDAVAGYFFLGGGEGTVRLRYGGPDDLHYLHRIDASRTLPCALGSGGLVPPDPQRQVEALLTELGALTAPDRAPSETRRVDSGHVATGGCAPLPPTFDIMVAYTNHLRLAMGGTAAVRAECILAVEVTQLTYDRAGTLIPDLARANAVWVGETVLDESGSLDQMLDELTDPSDGVIDGLHDTRNNVGADFVVLMVNTADGGGLAHCLSDESEAFGVVRGWQAVDALTFPHEVGHNIGCNHNPEEDPEPCVDSGSGHNFWVPALDAWKRSVMAYAMQDPGEERIPYYSHPDLLYEGVPTGTSDRDNLSVINWRRVPCADFRLTRMDLWTDFGYGGTETGSYTQPFDTVAESVDRVLGAPAAGIPVLHIREGSTSEAITISKRMVIEACGGTVTIGGS